MNSWSEKRKKRLTEEQKKELLHSREFLNKKRQALEQEERQYYKNLVHYLKDKGEID